MAVLAAVGASGACETEGMCEIRGVDTEEAGPLGMECISLERNHRAENGESNLTVYFLSLPEIDS